MTATAASQADADGVTTAPPRAPKTFNQTLEDIAYGDAHREATKLLAEALDAAKRLGRAASITVKLTFKPGKNGQVEVYPLVTNTVPKDELGVDILYFGDTGLQRQDPRQREQEGLRVIESGERAPARAADEQPRVLRTAT